MYILSTHLEDNYLAYQALQKIYGIGPKKSKFFLQQLGFSKNIKLNDLSKNQINILIRLIEKDENNLSDNLKRKKLFDRKRLINLKIYRGLRHRYNLPCRGQGTKTNARTRRKLINI